MKDISECRERLRGIFNITVTPFSASGDIDFGALRENIRTPSSALATTDC